MRRAFGIIFTLTLLSLACASSAPPAEEGPADQRTFAAPFERVFAAAREAGARAWGQPVRTADADNGVIVFEPRMTGNLLTRDRAPVPRSPWQDPGSVERENLTLYVYRGSDQATRVAVKLDADRELDERETDRLARKILDGIAAALR